jgi:hypothetical protein
LDPLVTGLAVALGPLMHGLTETPGLTVAGHLEHGLLSIAPIFVLMFMKVYKCILKMLFASENYF